MKSFSQYLLLESITKGDVQKWKNDAFAFISNVDKIKNGKQLCDVQNAFEVFRHNFYEFYYKRILGGNANIGQMPFTDLTKNLNDAGNDFLDGTDRVFLPKDTKDLKLEIKANEHLYVWYNEAWEDWYNDWKKSRSQVKTKLQKAIQPVFRALEDLINTHGEIEDKYVEHEYTLLGVPVVSHVKEKDQNQSKLLKRFEEIIKNSIPLIKKKNLSRIFSGLKVRIDLQQFPSQGIRHAGGAYARDRDYLWVFPLGIIDDEQSFIHEVGHRYFYQMLSNDARKTWADWILKRMTYFTQKEMYEIESAYEKAVEFMKKNFDDLETRIETTDGINTLWTIVDRFLGNELTRKKLRIVVKIKRGIDMSVGKMDLDYRLKQAW